MSTQAKHTPGPWQVTHLRLGIERINQFRIGGPSGEIARTPELPYETAQENEANARLIASAPALLEALEAALPALERGCLTASANGALIKARAAIQSAKGVSR